MDKYFTSTVFDIAYLFLILSALAGIITVSYSAVIRSGAREMSSGKEVSRKTGYLREMINRGKLSEKEVPGLLPRIFSLDDIIDILSGKGEVFPESIRGIIEMSLKSPGFTDKIKKWAVGIKKWKRIKSIIILGYLAPPRSVEILQKSAFSRDEDTAYFSLLSLGRIEEEGSIDAIFGVLKKRRFSGYKVASILEAAFLKFGGKIAEYLDDTEEEIRFWALKVLSRKTSPKYIEKVKESSEDKSEDIRAAACDYLGNTGRDEVSAILSERLKDKIWFVRIHAIRALENIRGEASIDMVAPLMRDENPTVRETAKNIITKYADKSESRIYGMLMNGDEKDKRNCMEIMDRSGLTQKVIERMLLDHPVAKDRDHKILEEMVKTESNIGIQGVLEKLPRDQAETVLRIIDGIDRDKSDNLREITRKRRVR